MDKKKKKDVFSIILVFIKGKQIRIFVQEMKKRPVLRALYRD
jgi:hypothetical protein